MIAKVPVESQARTYSMDVGESSPPLLMRMRAMKRLTPFYVPHAAKFFTDARENAFWATDRDSYMGFAYNKDKLPAHARWYIEKGMAIEQLERKSERWEKWLRELGRK